MRRLLSPLLALPLLVAACEPPAGGAPGANPSRASGQSALMGKTLAGQQCSAKTHDRPFIVEWDGTDLSRFESITTNDVVFVKYDGCNLEVIDTCRDDSVHGSLGSYRGVDWTSGSVEKIDIANEAELFAKLPLGAAQLGGRVQAGEQFHMEYFVSGVRSATRPAVYQGDLDANPGCRGVTHFVYAYNLGAFALGSTKNLGGNVGATVWGAGAGGSTKQSSAAEKRAGVLESCRSESARETMSCRSPIRVTLRAVEPGASPDAKAAIAPETSPDALSLAGRVDEKMRRNENAQGHIDAAVVKMNARDGKSCIAELDRADKLDPRPAYLSTRPGAYWSSIRARCLMLAGQCGPGRALERRNFEAKSLVPPDQIDNYLDGEIGQTCQGTKLSARDELLVANQSLLSGAATKKEPAFCRAAYDRVVRAGEAVTPGPDEKTLRDAKDWNHTQTAAECLARAGDCAAAWTMWRKPLAGQHSLARPFHSQVARCESYDPPDDLAPPGPPTTSPASPSPQEKIDALKKSIVEKTKRRDATCLSDVNALDPLLPQSERTVLKNGNAKLRVDCLVASHKCGDAERMYRQTTTSNPEVVERDVKKLRARCARSSE